jgi:multiple sugar transport system permease protein
VTPSRNKKGSRIGEPDRLLSPLLAGLVKTLLIAFVAVPVLYMLMLSVSPQFQILSGKLIPTALHFGNYASIWRTVPLAAGFANSLIVCGVSSVVAVILGTAGGYVLARHRFSLRGPMLLGTLGLQLVPGPMVLLPLFVLFAMLQTALGLTIIGSYWGVIISYSSFALPLALWLMLGYIGSIPLELEEAVFVDGGGPLRALWSVVAPLAVPGMVVALVFSLLLGWNDVLFATVLTNNATRTLAVDLSTFTFTEQGQSFPLYNQLMAAAVVAAVPVVAVYLALQRYLVSGLKAGAVK